MVAACPFPYPRGTPLRIERLAEALSHRGHEVHVVTYHLGSRRVPDSLQIHRTVSLPTYNKCTPGPTYQKLLLLDPLLALRLRQVLASRPFDVIHAHHYEGLLAAAAIGRRSRPPTVYDAHTLLASELPDYGLGLSRSIKGVVGRLFDRWLPQRADHVVTVTKDLREALIQSAGLPPDRVTVVMNGVELDLFDCRTTDKSPARKRCKQLIYTGNLAPYQGIDLMLRAFVRVRTQRPGTRLMLLTESSFDPYESLARDLGIRDQVDLHRGDINEAVRRLSEADVALNPRVRCPGIPQKLLNYMAARKAVVTFAGSAKVLKHCQSGLVVPDNNIEAFAAACVRLLDDERLAEALGDNARQHVEHQCTWERAGEATEAVYRRLVRACRKRTHATGQSHRSSVHG